MKIHLKLSENLLIHSNTSLLQYYNCKGINANIEFTTNLLLKTNFQNCLIFISTIGNFFITFFVKSYYKIEYVYLYLSDLGSTQFFKGICTEIRKLLTI